MKVLLGGNTLKTVECSLFTSQRVNLCVFCCSKVISLINECTFSHSLCLLKLTLESPGRIRKMECNLILSVYIYLNFYYLVTYCPIFISNYFVRPWRRKAKYRHWNYIPLLWNQPCSFSFWLYGGALHGTEVYRSNAGKEVTKCVTIVWLFGNANYCNILKIASTRKTKVLYILCWVTQMFNNFNVTGDQKIVSHNFQYNLSPLWMRHVDRYFIDKR